MTTPTGRTSDSRLRQLADEIYMDEKVEDYILNIVQATRTPENVVGTIFDSIAVP